MSTIKVNSIKNTSTDDGGIAIDNTGHVQVDGVQLPTAGQLSNRNLIINGAMQVAQRGTSFNQGSSSQYALDRFQIRIGSSFNADSTVTQDSSGPTGFTKSLKITPDSTQTPSGSHNAMISHVVEAQSLQHLAYNTSAAAKTTASFYVKSNKTGTYCFQVYNQDSGRIYMREYTISASDTWEHKTITIPGDTSGVINNDNGGGLFFYWHLASGSSDHASEDTAWRSSTLFQTTSNQVNFFDSTSNEFYLTGVQIEVGEKATSFEHRSYGDELAKCQRYYQQINGTSAYTLYGNGRAGSTTNVRILIFLKKTMRSVPTFASSGTFTTTPGGTVTGMSVTHSTADAVQLSVTSTSLVSGSVAGLNALNDSDTSLQFSAEL